MKKGLIFNIEEFSIYDGPGIRTAVFFKGCPLRCQWCHNPEGLSFAPQIVRNTNMCTHCGSCAKVCQSPGACVLCRTCVTSCPNDLIRVSGEEWTAEALAEKLWRYEDFYRSSDGGVTFSGGEVLAQADFLLEVLDRTQGLHRAVETSGYASADVFERAIERCELVMFDLKVMDDALHRKYTGVSNKRILANFELLKVSGKPFVARIPLIPGVNDNESNFEAVAALFAHDAENGRIEVLPYNSMAGAKYAMLGMEYTPGFAHGRPPESHFEPLRKNGIPWRIL